MRAVLHSRFRLRFASALQDFDHRGWSDDSCGSVTLEAQEFLIAGDEEVGLAGFGLTRKNGRSTTSRSSTISASEATSVKTFPSHASKSLAGGPTGDKSAERRIWCPE
jgi:hypothetical protein